MRAITPTRSLLPVAAVAERRGVATLAMLVDLFKVRIGVLMTVTALAGYAITPPGASLQLWQVALLALCVLGASTSAGAFNQYMETDLDSKMARTRKRAFVTGVAQRNAQWLWIIGGVQAASIGVAGTVFNLAVAAYLFLGAFVYGVVYTLWLKRTTSLNIVIGGASGSFAVLAGAAAANIALSPESLLLALTLFLWTPPHFWSLAIALREDYAAAGVPMLPVVVGDKVAARIILLNTLLLAAVSILPALYGLGAIYLVGAVAGGTYFIVYSVRLWRQPTKQTAIRCFLASLVQLSALLIAAVADTYFAR